MDRTTHFLISAAQMKEVSMGTGTMSCFSSLTAEQKQLLHVKIVLKRVNHLIYDSSKLLLMFPSIHQKLLAEFLQYHAGS